MKSMPKADPRTRILQMAESAGQTKGGHWNHAIEAMACVAMAKA